MGEKRSFSRPIFCCFSLVALQEKVLLDKVFEMPIRKAEMQSQMIFQMAEKRLNRIRDFRDICIASIIKHIRYRSHNISGTTMQHFVRVPPFATLLIDTLFVYIFFVFCVPIDKGSQPYLSLLVALYLTQIACKLSQFPSCFTLWFLREP